MILRASGLVDASQQQLAWRLELLGEPGRSSFTKQLPGEDRHRIGVGFECFPESDAGFVDPVVRSEALGPEKFHAERDLFRSAPSGGWKPVVVVPEPCVVEDRRLDAGESPCCRQRPVGVAPPFADAIDRLPSRKRRIRRSLHAQM